MVQLKFLKQGNLENERLEFEEKKPVEYSIKNTTIVVANH
jgi:hypothetical protein